MSRNSTSNCENVPTWDELEFTLATEIVEESRKKARKWFIAWLVTTAALVASNLAWIAGEVR